MSLSSLRVLLQDKSCDAFIRCQGCHYYKLLPRLYCGLIPNHHHNPPTDRYSFSEAQLKRVQADIKALERKEAIENKFNIEKLKQEVIRSGLTEQINSRLTQMINLLETTHLKTLPLQDTTSDDLEINFKQIEVLMSEARIIKRALTAN